jgi:hypothetical protein
VNIPPQMVNIADGLEGGCLISLARGRSRRLSRLGNDTISMNRRFAQIRVVDFEVRDPQASH